MITDGVTPLTDCQIRTVLNGTFGKGKTPDCDLILLRKDLAEAFEPLRLIAKDRRLAPYVRDIQKKLERILLKIQNTPKNLWMLNAAGRNHAAVEKERGIRSGDLTAYDRLVGSTGHTHFENFVEAEIQEFFRLRDQLIRWLSDDAGSERMFRFLKPATINTLITTDLPAIFKKHFPGEGGGNSPTSTCTEFIGHILREAGIYSGPDPNEMIVKRRQRRQRRPPKRKSVIA
jgi:hypothetical protein